MPVLPGLVALPPTKVKFTALPDKVSVIESESTAFNAIGLAPEFRTCARADAANIVAAASITSVPNLVRVRIAHFFLKTLRAQGQRGRAPQLCDSRPCRFS